jgi:hypothetical protein
MFVLINCSGRLVARPDVFGPGKYGPHFPLEDFSQHGWPMIFLERVAIQVGNPPTWRLSPWRIWEGAERVSWGAFAFNVTIAAMVVVAGATAVCSVSWKRGPRFGLRALFFAVTMCGITLSIPLVGYRREQRILDSISKLATPNTAPIHDRLEWHRGGPHWLRSLLGDQLMHVFDRVAGVDAAGSELLEVAKLEDLKVVRIMGSVSTRQLKLVSRCRTLEALYLMGVNVVDDQETSKLGANDAEVHPELAIPSLPKLRGINLYDTGFRGSGLDRLPSLESADLTETEIGDDDLGWLEKCPNLRALSLAGTELTDACLPKLKAGRQLRELYLTDTNISPAGIADLHSALPNCRITN